MADIYDQYNSLVQQLVAANESLLDARKSQIQLEIMAEQNHCTVDDVIKFLQSAACDDAFKAYLKTKSKH